MTRAQEKEASKFFGKHISQEKTVYLLIVTLLACAMPMLVGYRLWDKIPEIVETGLIGTNGEDDSMPRAVLVYGIPGLMCVLNLICHSQLYFNQKAQKIPPTPSRLIGRWGFPVLSVFFASACSANAADEKLSVSFIIPCVLGMVLLFIGSHFFDCKRDSQLALHFRFMEYKEDVWRITHRVAAVFWAAAGLMILFLVMFRGALPIVSVPLIIILLVFPILIGYLLSRRKAL